MSEKKPFNEVKDTSLETQLAEFVTVPPSEQNAFDLFPTSWSTAFEDVKTQGHYPGTKDPRINWLLENVNLAGKSVLELGPLEAGHTYMLEKSGAKVLAVEANKGAFLRSLIVKNHLNLSAKFLLGDFDKLNLANQSFELVLASGVLYHMTNPVEFLKKISRASNKLFLWTHYFEPDLDKWNDCLANHLEDGKWEYENPEIVNIDGLEIRLVKYNYKDALGWSGFCGGTEVYSKWIFKDDLLKLLDLLGFSQLKISFDDDEHQNGPSFCVLAEK
ncbi:class I SAM-dependent methyltransferase [Nitrosomonas sp. JL21]|uniref:class I SAM-dependent methyltransferase n=1 Tax=Nitrosomonas sp. JL21 TaxID=153949 RepID=UPI00136F7E14|nr:methyltransferase domain-containing protein [Nitrosomonas sp. JL21]MBL8498211.1 methyltransferase domain-containing protein [Nitrosomonas sp.]MXS78586.1 class I SAM-dependent methyltransferase [Nitrosomonas sp. JL21]